MPCPQRLLLQESTPPSASSTKRPLEQLGMLSASSTSSATYNLDWGLVEIDDKYTTFMTKPTNHPHVRSLVRQVSERANILALTANQGFITGFLSSNATYMQLPDSSVFQEVWTVKLDGTLRKS